MTTNFSVGRRNPFFTCFSMFLLCTIYAGSATAQVVNIPDENFKAALLADTNINTNGDNEIQVSEAEVFDGQVIAIGERITDLTGIEAFTSLTDLRVHYNILTSVDLSANTNLIQLHLQNNELTSLDLSANTELDMLRVQNNSLDELDLSANMKLRFLEVSNNNLNALNVQKENNIVMYNLLATGNPRLTCVQVDDVTYAEDNWSDNVDEGVSFSPDCGDPVIYIPDNAFKAFLVGDPDINSNEDDHIQVPEAEAVTILQAYSMGISDLKGIEAFTNLESLYAQDNNLATVDLSNNTVLSDVNVSNNRLTEIKVHPSLEDLNVGGNQLTSLDLSGTAIRTLIINDNNLAILNIRNGIVGGDSFYAGGNPNLSCIQVDDVEYAETNWSENVDEGVVFSTDCRSLNTVVNIPDANFKAALLADQNINTYGDDEIQVNEAMDFTGLIKINEENISDLTGIEAFVNLTELKAHYNNLSSVDLSANKYLRELHIQNNQITSLHLSSNPNLDLIRAQHNVLSSLDVSSNAKLRHLEVNNNNLTSLHMKNGKNYIMNKFEAAGNPDLTCIEVDDAGNASDEWSGSVDPRASFNEDCSEESVPAIITGAFMEDSPDLLVFPNPSADYMRVNSDTTWDELHVYSVNGQEMDVRFVSGEADIRHLNRGVYILKACIGGNVSTVKIVKQ